MFWSRPGFPMKYTSRQSNCAKIYKMMGSRIKILVLLNKHHESIIRMYMVAGLTLGSGCCLRSLPRLWTIHNSFSLMFTEVPKKLKYGWEQRCDDNETYCALENWSAYLFYHFLTSIINLEVRLHWSSLQSFLLIDSNEWDVY